MDCKKGPSNDKENFAALVRELSEEFKPRGLLLTAAVSPAKKVIDHGYDVPELNKYLDIINVMTYDYYGHWDKKTGHVAPLYHHPNASNPTFSAVSYSNNGIVYIMILFISNFRVRRISLHIICSYISELHYELLAFKGCRQE